MYFQCWKRVALWKTKQLVLSSKAVPLCIGLSSRILFLHSKPCPRRVPEWVYVFLSCDMPLFEVLEVVIYPGRNRMYIQPNTDPYAVKNQWAHVQHFQQIQSLILIKCYNPFFFSHCHIFLRLGDLKIILFPQLLSMSLLNDYRYAYGLN